MQTLSILVSSWSAGVSCISEAGCRQELAGQSVRSLAPDGRSGAVAIVGKHSLCSRSAVGEWSELAKSEFDLSCCVAIGNSIYVGTDDAKILLIDSEGRIRPLTGFDEVPGRDRWYAGTALFDGRVIGPPLGIRSLAATCNGAVILANVHVGGIPRSTDGGKSWQPTIDVECDVHQVCAHPARPDLLIAAAAVGLCISRDAGATWTIEHRGLHAPHCSGVAIGKYELFLGASTDPFTTQGAVYRRSIDSEGPLQRLGGSMPNWIEGIADTNCIAARDSMVAVVSSSGCLYVSHDDGAHWSTHGDRFIQPSGILLI